MITLAAVSSFVLGVIAGRWGSLRADRPLPPPPPSDEPGDYCRCGVCRGTYPRGWWHRCARGEEARA